MYYYYILVYSIMFLKMNEDYYFTRVYVFILIKT